MGGGGSGGDTNVFKYLNIFQVLVAIYVFLLANNFYTGDALFSVCFLSFCLSVDHFGISPGNVFVVHDELDKPVGKFGIKLNGSARFVHCNCTQLWIALTYLLGLFQT